MEWIYQGQPFTEAPEEFLGFVYVITNMRTMKKYIGQKKFWFKKTRQVKGKKKKFLAESDWKSYHGSNPQLLEELKELGAYKVHREILHFCKRKSEMNYLELIEQAKADVLRKPDEYYNAYIGGRISRQQLGV